MAKPPQSPPHTDLEGTPRDERGLVDAAAETGADGEDLELARAESKGKPAPPDQKSRDDRSR